MKTIAITTLVCLIGFAAGQRNLEKCPDIKMDVKPISPKSLLGVWYSIRIGPPCMDSDVDPTFVPPDCIVETYWADPEAAPGIYNTVMRMKYNGTFSDTTGQLNTTTTYSDRPDLPNNTWAFTLFNNTSPLTFLDTDGGRSWAIGYSCWEFGPKNHSANFFVASRLPYMDPKLERKLVGKILKLAPTVQEEELFAVGHTDCYGDVEDSGNKRPADEL